MSKGRFMHVVIGLVGAVVGGILEGDFGFIVGFLLGLGGSVLMQQRRDLATLTRQMASIMGGADPAAAQPEVESQEARREQSPLAAGTPADAAAEGTAAADSGEAAGATSRTREPASPPPQPAAAAPGPAATARANASATVSAGESDSAGATGTSPQRPPQPDRSPKSSSPSGLGQLLSRLGGMLKFFVTGNPVVRIGAVVLFFGVAFLLRYAYENAFVPVELRLAGACLGGIALTVFGWRLRHRADTYGLILQGAGVGILYLTVFATARLYEMISISAALGLLVALVVGSCIMAVKQKSQALATFAMSGGFLAPVLMSTGTGSHVALFSYYALLNAGILGVAWFQYWRWLNWVGFVFTFAIGAIWGYQYYQPVYFATTEPFIILFFLYYVGVSVLFARRKDVQLKGLVDGTLVFGTPIIAFSLQAALVADMEFGLAFSALGAGVVYALLALWLKRQVTISNLLSQSFVALAVAFATLAIPFAFDNQRFTAATWALEGAGLYWVGLRQAQLLPRLAGLLLQLAAAAAFWLEMSSREAPTLFLNSAYLGAAFVALAAGFTAYLMYQHREELPRLERLTRYLLLAWSVGWWLAGGVRELADYVPQGGPFGASNLNQHLLLLYATASLAALAGLARRCRWPEALAPGFLVLPIAVFILAVLDPGWREATVLEDLGWIAWPLTLVVAAWHLRQVDAFGPLAALWHAGFWWFVTLLATWNVAALLNTVVPGSIWTDIAWGVVPLAAAALMLRIRTRTDWPFSRFAGAYFGWGWLVVLGYLIAWLLVLGITTADPKPLPYLVLANPLEIVQMGILLLALFWIRTQAPDDALRTPLLFGLCAVSFGWINLVAARAVHFYLQVPYPLERIVQSDAFQATASILWTSIALVLMGLGTRRTVRVSWIAGAVLLVAVIVKLFLVDLGQLDMVARIVSFISVGVLMLVIGYFAPLPPRRADEASA